MSPSQDHFAVFFVCVWNIIPGFSYLCYQYVSNVPHPSMNLPCIVLNFKGTNRSYARHSLAKQCSRVYRCSLPVLVPGGFRQWPRMSAQWSKRRSSLTNDSPTVTPRSSCLTRATFRRTSMTVFNSPRSHRLPTLFGFGDMFHVNFCWLPCKKK